MKSYDMFKKTLAWLKHYASIIAIIQAIIFPVTFIMYNTSLTDNDVFMFGGDAVSFSVLQSWHMNNEIHGYRSLGECVDADTPAWYDEMPCSVIRTDLQIITDAFDTYEVPYDEVTINMVLTTLWVMSEPPKEIVDALMDRIPD